MSAKEREHYRAIELGRLAEEFRRVHGENDPDRRYIPYCSRDGSWFIINRQCFPLRMPLPQGMDTKRIATDMSRILNGEIILDHGMEVVGLLDEFHRLVLYDCPEYLTVVQYWQANGIGDPALQDRLVQGAADVLEVVAALRA